MDRKITDIYTTNPLTVTSDSTIHDCISVMRNHRISCLIIVDNNNKPSGIYTEADMVRTLNKGYDHQKITISQLMSSPVLTANMEINVFEATYLMTTNGIRHLVIVDKAGQLSGVVTQTDIIAHYGEDYFMGVRLVDSVMTKKLLTVESSAIVHTVVASMEHFAAGCAIAIDAQSKPIGILTERDMAALIVNGADIDKLTMAEVMTSPVITVRNSITTYEAVAIMNKHRVRRIVVVDDEGVIAGILVQENIIRDLEGNYIDFLKQVLWDRDRNLAKAKEHFKEKSIHLDNILRSSLGMALVATDSNFNISYLNHDAQGMFAVKESEAIGMPITKLLAVHEFDGNTLEKIKTEVAVKGDYWLSHVRKTGQKLCHIKSRITAISDEDGRSIGYTIVSHDITEKLHAEERLMLAAQVYESVIEGIMVTDSSGTIQSVNPAFTDITGYSAEEAVGKNPRLLRSDRQEPEFYQAMWQTLQEKGRWEGEIWNRRKNGETYPERLTISSVKDGNGDITQFIGVFYDITDIKVKEEKIRHRACHDPLTELPNRQLFKDRLKHAISRVHRVQKKLAVMFVDIDRFKYLNDTFGHYAGDKFLQFISREIAGCLREEDTVSRFGGDEFTILLEDCHDYLAAIIVAEKILTLFENPYMVGENEIQLGASIGIALYPKDGEDADALLRNADTAMYHVKETGRNNYQLFQKEMEIHIKERVSLELDLRRALSSNEFCVHYQPIIDLQNKTITSMEALIRWNKKDGKTISPAQFIPIAEDSGLIVPIGEWVLRKSSSQLAGWLAGGANDVSVSVNLSARQFREKQLVKTVERILDESELDPQQLHLEITESAMMDDLSCTIDTLRKLKDMGVLIYMDDFGTGYSSLTYLKKLPVDVLKLDHTFIHDIVDDSDAARLAAGIISMAKDLRLEVIAEGVENETQLHFLEDNGCDKVQGFLFHKPLAWEEVSSLLLRAPEK